MKTIAWALGLVFAASAPLWAQSAKETEEDYYPLIKIPVPAGIVLEAGGIELMPDGKVAVSTRRGEIWMIDKAFENPPVNAKFTLFASGLH